jgi:putative nucleotide binding protein|tara:strand:+ start:279 stop:854 length:576 start_codon:yes stop_codon:yes gene_type:complete
VIVLERVNTQSRKYEEYAYVLDFSSMSKSKTVRGRDGIIITALGEERLTLLEILGVEDSTFDIGEKIYIGKEGRTKVQSVLGKLDYEQISGSAQSELTNVVRTIVKNNEQRFVDYVNNAQPLTPRKHSLELIPGIGKTYLKLIIEQINKQKFLNYQDMEERAGLKEPVNHLSKRILEEISGETQFRLFVKR